MRKSYHKSRESSGYGWIIFLLVLVAGFVILGWKALSHEAPAIKLTGAVKGIGKQTTVEFLVQDNKYSLKNVSVNLQQGNRNFSVPLVSEIHKSPVPSWWKFWAKRPVSSGDFKARIGQHSVPDLKEGRATLKIVATNNSWGRFFRGGRNELRLDLPVRFHPPEIQVLTSQV